MYSSSVVIFLACSCVASAAGSSCSVVCSCVASAAGSFCSAVCSCVASATISFCPVVCSCVASAAGSFCSAVCSCVASATVPCCSASVDSVMTSNGIAASAVFIFSPKMDSIDKPAPITNGFHDTPPLNPSKSFSGILLILSFSKSTKSSTVKFSPFFCTNGIISSFISFFNSSSVLISFIFNSKFFFITGFLKSFS